MGYFLNMAVDMRDDEDHSCPPPERQLLWRLDDLKDRLSELVTTGGMYRSGYIYPEDDIRYALPEHLGDISKVERAIKLAKEDLLNKYGINVYEAEKTDSTEEIVSEFETEDGFEQIVLIDTILPVSCRKIS